MLQQTSLAGTTPFVGLPSCTVAPPISQSLFLTECSDPEKRGLRKGCLLSHWQETGLYLGQFVEEKHYDGLKGISNRREPYTEKAQDSTIIIAVVHSWAVGKLHRFFDHYKGKHVMKCVVKSKLPYFFDANMIIELPFHSARYQITSRTTNCIESTAVGG